MARCCIFLLEHYSDLWNTQMISIELISTKFIVFHKELMEHYSLKSHLNEEITTIFLQIARFMRSSKYKMDEYYNLNNK